MRDDRPSFTAAWVAACRGASDLLPDDARLVHDPYGVELAGPMFARAVGALRRAPGVFRRTLPLGGPLSQSMLWLQLRTFTIDNHLRDFVGDGGRQVVLLGAGLDARAWRLASDLEGAHVYEVDHPATQKLKKTAIVRAARDASPAPHTFVTWDFERKPMADLPAALEASGLDRRAPVLTIWEGVTMYLSRDAIDSSLRAISAYSAPQSKLVLTYFEAKPGGRLDTWTSAVTRVVALFGEPFTFGWRKGELASDLDTHGFTLDQDDSGIDLARRLLPAGLERPFRKRGGHVAVATRR